MPSSPARKRRDDADADARRAMRLSTWFALAAGALVLTSVGEERFQCVADEESIPAVGQRCWFTIPAAKTLVFDADSGERIVAA